MSILCPHCQKEIDSQYIAKHLGATGGKVTLAKHGKDHYIKLAVHMNKIKDQKRKALEVQKP